MSSIKHDTALDFFRYFSNAENIAITAHIGPDGDAVGSCVALRHYLAECLGKNAFICLQDACPDSLSFLAEGEGICEKIPKCDLVVCLDVTGFNRTGDLKDSFLSMTCPKLLVDHHKEPHIEQFNLWLSDTEVSSTCELLYELLKLMPGIDGKADNLPFKTLEALMTGMTTDTNNFANSVFPGTLSMASELLAAGVDRDRIIDQVLNSFRENRILVLGNLLEHSLAIKPEGYAYMILDAETIRKYDIREGETEGFVNLPLSIKKVKLSIFIKEDNGFFRVSLRSKIGVSARDLAVEYFHGGGHEQASGGRLFIPQDVCDAKSASDYIEKAVAQSGIFRHD